MKILEEDVEKSLQREESKLDAEEEGYPDNVQKVVQELKSRHNVSESSINVSHFANNGTRASSRPNNYENA